LPGSGFSASGFGPGADAGCPDGVVHVKIISPAAAGVETGAAVPRPRDPGPGAEAIPSSAAPPARTAKAVPAGAGSAGMAPPCTPRLPMALPGLVGSSPAWRRACRDAEAGYDSGEWLTVEGENGAGKLSLIRAVHQRRSPAASFHVADARDIHAVQAELREGTGMLVIRRAEAASARDVRALIAALAGAPAPGPRVAVTLDRAQAHTDLTALLRLFPGTIDVPPLRHHSEDLTELVPFFLARLGQHGHLTCSPAAMQLLLRHNWPGNTGQLWDVLKQVVQRRRAGAIMPQDLPPECWSVSRRVLSPLEAMERDAIVQSLRDHEGNKIRAARALGMSRATIYRRIHEYGIIATPG
jgi:transcriptional regulator of acetoin/glycerol metabolism